MADSKKYVSNTLPVQWGDQDSFGHVNNVVFFRWFESGRLALLERVGIQLGGTRPHIGPILAFASANYRRQLTYPDTVEVRTWVGRMGRTSVTVEQEIRSLGTGEVVADGSSVVVLYDFDKNVAVELPGELRAALENPED
ncbi:MAG: thioesterase family protein [Bryobacteraceae bacterium]|nr:thioesterase family protein [Bryobacteraceae bacterium]